MNYFEGTDPAIGEIKIRVGQKTETVNFKLAGPIGQAGEEVVPYIIGYLNVTEDQGVLSYNFTEWQPECDDFSVFLSWGNQSNVNLLITEPTNKVVNSLDSEGDIGSFVQNSNGEFGPKIYKTECEKLQNGNYSIDLKHLSAVPTTANVLIRARSDWYWKSINLTNDQ